MCQQGEEREHLPRFILNMTMGKPPEHMMNAIEELEGAIC
jgi:hypothetical protein